MEPLRGAPELWAASESRGAFMDPEYSGTLLGTPNWEPQEYTRIGIYLPESLYSILFYSHYILGVLFLWFPLEPF